MKLKQIMPGGGSTQSPAPTISVCYFNGRISFNKPTCELIGLAGGNEVAFFQDEECPTDWYFSKGKIPGALKIIEAKQTNNIQCNNTVLARKFLGSLNLHETRRFYIDPVAVDDKYFKILTHQPIK